MSTTVSLSRLAALSGVALSLALSGCLSNSGSPQTAPTNVTTYAGDASVSVSWDQQPGITYWLYYAQDPTLTPASLNAATPVLNMGVVQPVVSPVTMCNPNRTVINNSPAVYSYYPPIYFSLNGRTGTAPGGAGSPPVSVVPRPAASPGVPWISGSSIPGGVTKLAYVPISACGTYNMPAQGLYLAVGSAGNIYSSMLAPSIAGPLSNPGNNAMTWTPGNLPLGFSGNLNSAAGRAGGVPGATTYLLVAVGNYGSLLYSVDGRNWSHSPSAVTSANLNDVASSGSSFIAVGDNGVVITSSDGINWNAPTANNAFSANPASASLRAIRCAPQSGNCVAVGDGGTILYTTNGGAAWTAMPAGTNNWVAVAYGNADANFSAVVNNANGTVNVLTSNELINTWVVVDGQGNYVFANPSTGGLNTGGHWMLGNGAIAPGIVAIDYTSNFVAIDNSGNTWMSATASYGAWANTGAAPVAGGGAGVVSMVSNGHGFVAVGANGANAANF
jgi:photosystem II stability/assembly factor-like uncharacterized protein